jgi:hypothetical protein
MWSETAAVPSSWCVAEDVVDYGAISLDSLMPGWARMMDAFLRKSCASIQEIQRTLLLEPVQGFEVLVVA